MHLQDYQKAKQGLLASDLSKQAKWKLSGKDRVRYLNGQTTCDIAALQPGSSTLGGVTNLKGKLEGSLRVACTGNDLLVDTDPRLAESLFTRLNKYIIADEVELIDIEPEWKLYHFLFANPLSTYTKAGVECLCFQSNRFGLPGWDLWIPSSAEVNVPCAASELWETLRIEQAVPLWGVDMDQNNLAPEMPFERLNGLSYSKGCYIGQEVIARIRSRGHVNKQLCLLQSNTDSEKTLPLPLPCMAGDKMVGTATSSAFSPSHGRTLVLATLSRQQIETKEPVLIRDNLFQIISI
jgi:tRNA-modifying protein YgfZ